MYNTPILFLIFNRPDNTQKVFNEIRKAKPKKLYVAADGPRIGNLRDLELCEETRKVINDVDWECDLNLLFREKNLGCKNAVSSAIDWFFDNEPEGVILEDDCLPNTSFFRFCAEMLETYRDDERIMMVSGDNFQDPKFISQYSYYFSTYANIWGWATWRRAWQKYDVSIKLWPEIKEKKIHYMFSENRLMPQLWEMILEDVYYGKLNTWDYQWNFACKINNGLSVIPQKNLITNIGVGEASTHTDGSIQNLGFLKTDELDFPIVHPPYVFPDKEADRRLVETHYSHLKRYRLRYMLKKQLPPNVIKFLKRSM